MSDKWIDPNVDPRKARHNANNDKVLMPKELTAENGAKALLMGEFYYERDEECPDCCGDGCGECDDGGYVIEVIPVTWTTIKAIYKKAVEFLGEKV